MAIATAKRLGALVEAYDVRRAAGEQVRSLGAKFLELQINAEGAGGYARELTEDEKKQEAEMVAKAVAEADIVITTANVPGPPCSPARPERDGRRVCTRARSSSTSPPSPAATASSPRPGRRSTSTALRSPAR